MNKGEEEEHPGTNEKGITKTRVRDKERKIKKGQKEVKN
jgi:hypothetical protein